MKNLHKINMVSMCLCALNIQNLYRSLSSATDPETLDTILLHLFVLLIIKIFLSFSTKTNTNNNTFMFYLCDSILRFLFILYFSCRCIKNIFRSRTHVIQSAFQFVIIFFYAIAVLRTAHPFILHNRSQLTAIYIIVIIFVL